MKDLFLEKFDKFIDWFSKIFSAISNVPNKIFDFFKSFLTKFFDLLTSINNVVANWAVTTVNFLNMLFIPTDEDIAKNTNILKTAVENKFTFINDFKQAVSNINVSGEPLVFSFSFLKKWNLDINLAWYEPMRSKVRSGLSVIFLISCALSCFRLISGIFSMSINKGGSNNDS